jgi:hypothetical protein
MNERRRGSVEATAIIKLKLDARFFQGVTSSGRSKS